MKNVLSRLEQDYRTVLSIAKRGRGYAKEELRVKMKEYYWKQAFVNIKIAKEFKTAMKLLSEYDKIPKHRYRRID